MRYRDLLKYLREQREGYRRKAREYARERQRIRRWGSKEAADVAQLIRTIKEEIKRV